MFDHTDRISLMDAPYHKRPREEEPRLTGPTCKSCGGRGHTNRTCSNEVKKKQEQIKELTDDVWDIFRHNVHLIDETELREKLAKLLECHAHGSFYYKSPLLNPKTQPWINSVNREYWESKGCV